jgi:signal transduction histidine kinase
MTFGALFLALSAALGIATFGFARSYLLHQRESSAVRQTLADARVVATGVQSADADIPSLLDSLGTRSGSDALVFLGSQVFASSVNANAETLPDAFTEALRTQQAVQQRFTSRHMPCLAVGVRLSAGVTYVEVFPLVELDHTLRIVSTALLGAVGATTVVGTLLGFAVSNGVLRPVTAAATTAAALAKGQLDARMTTGQDRDLRTLASSFNLMADALQERIQRDAAFAADVSHELRSPLTTLVTAAGVLEADRDQLPARDRQAVDLVVSELTRFEHLIEDLIEIARSDAGAAMERETLDVRVLILESLRRSPGPPVTFEVDEQRGPFVVEGNKLRLERVLRNLLDNAERHGGGATRIGLATDKGSVRIEVDDNGPGVSPADRHRIFERFARGTGVAGRRERTGSGIGLALVSEYVRLHDGKVWVEDRPGGGARFVVELPRVPL